MSEQSSPVPSAAAFLAYDLAGAARWAPLLAQAPVVLRLPKKIQSGSATIAGRAFLFLWARSGRSCS